MECKRNTVCEGHCKAIDLNFNFTWFVPLFLQLRWHTSKKYMVESAFAILWASWLGCSFLFAKKQKPNSKNAPIVEEPKSSVSNRHQTQDVRNWGSHQQSIIGSENFLRRKIEIQYAEETRSLSTSMVVVSNSFSIISPIFLDLLKLNYDWCPKSMKNKSSHAKKSLTCVTFIKENMHQIITYQIN